MDIIKRIEERIKTSLGSLNGLYLSNNELQFVPKIIGQFKKLRILYLYNNKLHSLPKEIGLLNDLMIMRLNNNQFKTIPKEIRQLDNLRCLYLHDNQLKTIPLYLNDYIYIKIDNNPIKDLYIYEKHGYYEYKRIVKTLIYIQRMYKTYIFLFDFYSVY